MSARTPWFLRRAVAGPQRSARTPALAGSGSAGAGTLLGVTWNADIPWDPEAEPPPLDDEPPYDPYYDEGPVRREPLRQAQGTRAQGTGAQGTGVLPVEPAETTPVETTSPETAVEALQRVFGYETFRGDQAAIIQNVIDGGDTVVLMPTGGGKSLCYQIPSLVRGARVS